MFNTTSNLLTPSGLTADQINELLNGEGDFEGLGEAILAVETQYGYNAFALMAQMRQEVGASGHSEIADSKHNLFGVDAYDTNSDADASTFDSFADSVANQGVFLNADYLHPGDKYYVSATWAGIAQHYATDANYASEVVGCMNYYYNQSLSLAHAPAAPAPVVSAGQVVVQAGQNMSLIATAHGITLSALEAVNPQAGHPNSGDFSDIWAGDVLNLPNSANPTPAEPSAVYVTVPPAPAGDLSNLAAKYGSTIADIVSWNQAKYPTISPDNVDAGWYIRVK